MVESVETGSQCRLETRWAALLRCSPRKLIEEFNGREIKTMGDSFVAAFRSVEKALDYAMALQANPGHPHVQIRAGIHIGPMQVEENDVFGETVNFAARVVRKIEGAEIWLSDRAKEDLTRNGARQYSQLRWERHDAMQIREAKEVKKK